MSNLVEASRAALTLGGIALVGYGAWLHYPPAGFIAAGALLLGVGIGATLRAR